MNIRPLTADDLKSWWPDVSLPRTVRGFVAEHEGRIMGLAGVMYLPSRILGFAEMVQEGQQYPLTIMRMAHRMRTLLRSIHSPVFAEADERYPNSPAFLEHIGFEHVQGALYVFQQEGG
jgi:hypothetical protein